MISPQQWHGPTELAVPTSKTPAKSTSAHVNVGIGLGYLSFTLVCMVGYVLILAPSLTNDLYWPTYNRTGFAVFLVDLVNVKLRTAKNESANLLAIDTLSSKSYASDVVQAEFESAYARKVFYTELTSLSRAIRDIRSLTTVIDFTAHYCWVDLDRRWDIAHTPARAARCLARYTDNAANYLETTLRNTNWTTFFNANRETWTVTIGRALQASPEGNQWLRDRPVQARNLSIPDEVAFLQSRNLTRYVLQYQNSFHMSMAETVEVESAFQQRQTLTIKAASYSTAPWTTINLYWNFRNDLVIVNAYNKSIVRGDSNHLEQVGWDWSMFYFYQDDDNRYWDQYGVFHDSVSPFGSADAFVEPVPAPLLALYAKFAALLNDRLWPDLALAARLFALADVPMSPQPPNFLPGQNMTYYGGNLLCMNGPATTYPQAQFAFDDACSKTLPFAITGKPLNLLFASVVSNDFDPDAVCTVKAKSTAACASALRDLEQMVTELALPLPELQAMVAQVMADLPRVEFYQYAKNATKDWVLLRQPLLTAADPNWSFIGWLAIFDWIQGKREVVRIEGDVSTVVMMSEVNPTLLLPLSGQTQGDQSGPKTMYFLVLYTTLLSLVVGGMILFYAIWNGFRFHGRNLLRFNRVACFVWIGRPLLLLRGLTAVLLLSSTTASIVQEGIGQTKLVAAVRPLWKTLLVSGESTWVCFVVCDVLLIFTGTIAVYFAPLACVLAWGATLVVELPSPIGLPASFDRRCVGVAMNQGIDCTSGVIQTGDWDRFLTLVAAQVTSVVMAIVMVVVWKGKKKREGRAPLLLHGAAESFLDTDQDSTKEMWHLDDVSCVMTGLLPFTYHGRHYTFDIKLWLLIQDNARCLRTGATMTFRRPSFASGVLQKTAAPTTAAIQAVTAGVLLQRLTVLGGFAYLILSGVGSVSYIAVSTVNFGNDFYWATFNMTGHHVVIADWFNRQFMLRNASLTVRLDDSRWSSLWRNYSNPKITTSTPASVGLLVQLDHMTDLEVAIAGLRRSNPCTVPWISTQYCWVDFERKWPMANSKARQQRCVADVSNGAVYLEAVLRNVDWSAFAQCWGSSFDTAIASDLKTSTEGRTWLNMVQSTPVPLENELTVWENAGIVQYVVQWQTYKKHGLINSYMIENALGVQYPMTLTRGNGSYIFASQTSFKMYWGLASDLWAVSSNKTLLGGKSLISTSANYAFANQTMLTILLQNGTLSSPLFEAFGVVQREIGPFGSIDMTVIPCPASVRQVYATGIEVIRKALASTPTNATRAYFNNTLELLGVMPTLYKTLSYFATSGGSIMCPETKAYSMATFTQFTRRDVACGSVFAATMYPSIDTLMMAAMAAQLGHANTTQIDRICWHDRNFQRCRTLYMPQTTSFLRQYVSPDDVQTIEGLAIPAATQVRALQVVLMQYIRQSRTAPLQMGRATLMNASDSTYDYWSWLYVLEWATGTREVVTFRGDAGSINILTDTSSLYTQSVQLTEMPTTFATYARSGVQYVTGVMLGIAGFIGLCILTSRGRIEGYNMFELNRVGGMVWVGRPLLLLRGLTALCLLSTATLELAPLGWSYTEFHVPSLPWYKTFLSAGEVTWLVYILNDVLTIWTKQYTQYYAPISSTMVWIASAVLTYVAPVIHRAVLDPHCHVEQMDFQMVCESGVVYIGDSNRLYWLVGIIGICNVVSYILTRMLYGSKLQAKTRSSLLLSSGAKYLFDKRNWMHRDIYYMDAASGFLNGLLSLRWGKTSYVVDIKLWRGFSIEIDDDVPSRVAYAIPLAD